MEENTSHIVTRNTTFTFIHDTVEDKKTLVVLKYIHTYTLSQCLTKLRIIVISNIVVSVQYIKRETCYTCCVWFSYF